MKSEFESCCKARGGQCTLNARADIIVLNVRKNKPPLASTTSATSILSKFAGEAGCPPPEIARVRKQIAEATGDRVFISRMLNDSHFSIPPLSSDVDKPSFPIGFKRGESYRQVKDRKGNR